MKKYLMLFLMMFALSFAFACGKEDETNDDKQNQTVEYTVTFVVDGEKNEVKVKDGEKAVKPADPVKEGYTFLGWYVGEEAYDFEKAVNADLEVTAKFEENAADEPGDEPGEESEVFYANYTHPKLGEVQFTLEFNGDGTGYYNFMVGGYTGTFAYEENALSNFVAEFGAAVEVTAIYAEGVYYATIVFTDVDQTVTVEFSKDAKPGDEPVFESEVYKAYFTHPKTGMQIEFTLEFAAEGTGYYNFMMGGYTGTFSYEENALSNFVAEFGAPVEFTAIYAEGVYYATIVFTDADQTVNVEFSKDAEPGVEPEVKEYNVTFVVDGVSEVVAVKEGEKVAKPADPVKEGYNFLGWYAGEDLFNFEAPINADVELVAKFEEAVVEKYTVKFIVDGVVVSEQLVEKGKDAELPEDPVKEGADFGYWDGIYEKVQKDEEVVAVFDYYLYAVVFMADGQLYGDPAEVEHGQDCPVPADPVKEGYKFVGWDKELTNITYELIVNAIFELETYTIKYYADGVELTDIEPKTYTYEDAFELTVNDVEGYGFLGWFDNADYIGEAKTGIAAKSFGNIELYALNVKVDNNGAEESWTWEEVAGYDYSKGIDAISNLPEVFEADFFKYLSDNNFLDDSRVGDTVKVSSWAEFSQVNPIHNGDPQRIWNDTTSNKTGTPNGYVSIFLFDKLEVNDDLTIKDVTGGFLGTEPYKTKYFGLLSSLVIMQNHKISTSKYIPLATSTDTARAFCAFIIDGYFYGTQGLSSTYFAELRKVIPGTTYGYKLVGESIVKVDYEKSPMAIGVKEGYVFDGWYIDQECTKKVGSEKMTNKQTIYVKWSPVA